MCGRENPAEEPNCLNCGARLYNNQNGGKAFIPPVELPNMDKQPFGKVVNISPMDMLGRNTVGDTAEFIGVNAQTYIPSSIKCSRKKEAVVELGGVLLCAVLVFYRKMQNIGCIFIAVLLVISGACTTKSVMAASSNVMQVYEITQTARPLPRI